MNDIISDQEIKALIKERKVLPENWNNQFTKRINRGNTEFYQNITGDVGNKFRFIIRINEYNKDSFSVILCVSVPSPRKFFNLNRYNGCNHEHTNDIEAELITGFHIHTATERYQQIGKREESYAQKTDRYSDVYGALQCLFTDANFEVPTDEQLTLFKEV